MSKKKSKRSASRQGASASNNTLLIVLGGLGLIAVAALLILSSGAASTPPAAVEVSGRPALKPDKEKVDLGNVRLGEWVNVSFELANVGDQPLRFTESPYVEVAAGC